MTQGDRGFHSECAHLHFRVVQGELNQRCGILCIERAKFPYGKYALLQQPFVELSAKPCSSILKGEPRERGSNDENCECFQGAQHASVVSGKLQAIPRTQAFDVSMSRHHTSAPAMTYSVKELFFTLQGEGARAGRAAVFMRFAGCNLWNGREQDRATALCRFCDTDFIGTDGEGGGKHSTAASLADAALGAWGPRGGKRYVVLTGGEPMLQVDDALVDALHARDFEIAIETNGTLAVHPGIDWVCVSPKARGVLVQTTGHELKLVFPQEGAEPARYEALAFEHFFLQPMDDLLHHNSLVSLAKKNTERCVEHCRENPQWRLSLQTHKILQIP